MSSRFDEASGAMVRLLQEHHYPTAIAWTFREDFAFADLTMYVNGQTLAMNLEIAKTRYESKGACDLGSELFMVCHDENNAYCSIWIPSNDREAELRMVNGSKMSVPKRTPRAILVEDELAWQRLSSLTTNTNGRLDEVQSRY